MPYFLSLFVVLLLFLSSSLKGESIDSLPSAPVYVLDISRPVFWEGVKRDSAFVSSLTHMHTSPTRSVQTLGIIGGAQQSLYYRHNTSIGFALKPSTKEANMFTPTSSLFLHSANPYTYLYYTAGSFAQQSVRVMHATKLNKHIAVGIDYRYMTNFSAYYNHKNKVSNLSLYSFTTSDSLRYTYLFNLNTNASTWYENGGIVADTVFVEGDEYNKLNSQFFKLRNAQSTEKSTLFFLHQSYRLWGKKVVKDTLVLGRRWVALESNARYAIHKYGYQDKNDTLLFNQVYGNRLLTSDGIIHQSADVCLGFSFQQKSPLLSKLLVSSGVMHDQVLFNRIGESYNQPYIALNAYKKGKIHSFLLESKYILGRSYNQGNYSVSPSYIWADSATFTSITLSTSVFKQSPYYVFSRYASNHFAWQYALSPMQGVSLNGHIRYKQTNIMMDYIRINNLVSFDGLPQWHAGSEYYLLCGIDEDIPLGKRVVWKNNVLYNLSAKNASYSLPTWVVNQGVFVHFSLFKKALHVSPGIDFSYVSRYYADGYMPHIDLFYRQLSVFQKDMMDIHGSIRARIKRANFFLTYYHLGELVFKTPITSTPNYPISPMVFRFGVSWEFFD